jgi:hypothetical protein
MLTDCHSGKKVPVFFRNLSSVDIRRYKIIKSNGWLFNWKDPLKDGYELHGMFVDTKSDVVQGVIALKPNFDPAYQLIHVQLVEAAPHNKLNNPSRVYSGVGLHLIAYACYLSFTYELDGYVYLKSKSSMLPFYEKIGANVLHGTSKAPKLDLSQTPLSC